MPKMAVDTNEIIGAAIALVVIGVVAGVGILILTNIGNSPEIANNTNAQQALSNSQNGIVNLTTLLGVAGIVVVAGFILWIIMRSFVPSQGSMG